VLKVSLQIYDLSASARLLRSVAGFFFFQHTNTPVWTQDYFSTSLGLRVRAWWKLASRPKLCPPRRAYCALCGGLLFFSTTLPQSGLGKFSTFFVLFRLPMSRSRGNLHEEPLEPDSAVQCSTVQYSAQPSHCVACTQRQSTLCATLCAMHWKRTRTRRTSASHCSKWPFPLYLMTLSLLGVYREPRRDASARDSANEDKAPSWACTRERQSPTRCSWCGMLSERCETIVWENDCMNASGADGAWGRSASSRLRLLLSIYTGACL